MVLLPPREPQTPAGSVSGSKVDMTKVSRSHSGEAREFLKTEKKR